MNTVKIETAEQFIDFGRGLIETQDLDPLYVGVWGAEFDKDALSAFLVAYWCFYNAGFACQAVDALAFAGPDVYWAELRRAASGRETARATERRHFRGQKAVLAVDALQRMFPRGPRAAVDAATGNLALTSFRTISNRVQTWPQFGPWIAFKAADMIDRCGYAFVDDTGCDLAMYDAPKRGAQAFAELSGHGADTAGVLWAVQELRDVYAGMFAPPSFDRALNIFEIETVLCKTKSAMGGHYYLGKDTIEIRETLERYADLSDTAALVLEGMPSWPAN